MNNQSLLYSYDKKITIGELKNKIDFDGYDFSDITSQIQSNNIHAIVDGESDFHYKFNIIKSQPYIIYYIGDLSLLDKDILGIVGPRKKTSYSDKVLDRLLQSASKYDLVTISGMAEGVDQLCHSFSIKNNVPTIAVLGGGIMRYLNRAERNIISSIVDHGGLIISEFKLSFEPTNYSFPQRNRLIAGLCNTLFLPQAGSRSGSLITVDFAIDMSKPIYGVADNIFSLESLGLHQYIADKKINLVSDFDKFLSSHFHYKGSDKNISTPDIILSENEKKILTTIAASGSISVDELYSLSHITYQELFGLLTILEMNNLIYQPSPSIYKIL
ncbi:MAG: DNA-processing protein DprA [Candidatus Absconditicoccaceae bacterium]